VSLGYGQSTAGSLLNVEYIKREGIDLVRRPTGGGAILHDMELTYSIVSNCAGAVFSGGVINSYRRISRAIYEGLRYLGIDDLKLKQPGVNESKRKVYGGFCFGFTSDYEIQSGGKKLVGSAQLRRGSAILQHGSILIDIDFKKVEHVFKNHTPGDEPLVHNLTTLREITGNKEITFEAVEDAIIYGFKKFFGVNLHADRLSQKEQQRAQFLLENKYGLDCWNYRR
jgi:lipoate-protein ligase A